MKALEGAHTYIHGACKGLRSSKLNFIMLAERNKKNKDMLEIFYNNYSNVSYTLS